MIYLGVKMKPSDSIKNSLFNFGLNFRSSARSSSLPPGNRITPAQEDATQSVASQNFELYSAPASTSVTPREDISPVTQAASNHSSSGLSSPREGGGGSSRWRSILPSLISPRSGQMSAELREKLKALDEESRAACAGLSSDDVEKYVGLNDAEQRHYNEHDVEMRKLFLLLSPDEREDCCLWHDVGMRSLYLGLSVEEKKRYREYARELDSQENSVFGKNRNKGRLKVYLELTKQEREELIRAGIRLEKVRKALGTAKMWDGMPRVKAQRFCADESFSAVLQEYLAKYGENSGYIEELGGLMLSSGLLEENNFETKADVEAWLRANTAAHQ